MGNFLVKNKNIIGSKYFLFESLFQKILICEKMEFNFNKDYLLDFKNIYDLLLFVSYNSFQNKYKTETFYVKFYNNILWITNGKKTLKTNNNNLTYELATDKFYHGKLIKNPINKDEINNMIKLFENDLMLLFILLIINIIQFNENLFASSEKNMIPNFSEKFDIFVEKMKKIKIPIQMIKIMHKSCDILIEQKQSEIDKYNLISNHIKDIKNEISKDEKEFYKIKYVLKTLSNKISLDNIQNDQISTYKDTSKKYNCLLEMIESKNKKLENLILESKNIYNKSNVSILTQIKKTKDILSFTLAINDNNNFEEEENLTSQILPSVPLLVESQNVFEKEEKSTTSQILPSAPILVELQNVFEEYNLPIASPI